MNSIGAIILARMDSRRLPGKVLARVGGRPLIDYVLQRCRRAAELQGNIVLATSDREVDDPLAEFSRASDVELFRGDSDDVAGRVLACARKFGYRYFARVNADSPFLEPSLIDEAIRLVGTNEVDLVTNLVPRTFPYGISVELVRTDTFAKAYPRMVRPDQRELPIIYFYENIQKFRYLSIACPSGNLSKTRLTVDTPEDLRWFGRLAAHYGRDMDRISYIDAIRFLSEGPASS
jgi:spore coat polysaccharide biosynthesis protein SpsF (cytidylyltransferase family)